MAGARKKTKKTHQEEKTLVCAMRLRVYLTDKQAGRAGQWLSASHLFRNEAVAFLNEWQSARLAWMKQHPQLAKEWIPEEFNEKAIKTVSSWLTERLERARKDVARVWGIRCPKNALTDRVATHYRHLTREERDEVEGGYLLTVPRTVLDQVVQDLGKSFDKALDDRKARKEARRSGGGKSSFSREVAGFPRFHKWQFASSARAQVVAEKNQVFRDHWQAGELFIPGLGRLKFRDSGYVLPKNPPSLITIARNAAGQWHVSFTCVEGEGKAHHRQQAARGAALPLDAITGFPVIHGNDLGLRDRNTSSNGAKTGRERHLKRYARGLRKANKDLSRKQKGSGHWKRQKLKLGRLHTRIANRRETLLRQEAKAVVDHSAIICLESLFLGGMLRNTRTSQSAYDAALGKFTAWIEHECAKQGKLLLRCDRFDASSKTCSDCGFKLATLDRSATSWICPGCNTHHDRDLNAAYNIRLMALQRAIRLLSSTSENDVRVLSSHPLHAELEAFIARGGLTALLEHFCSGESQPREACISSNHPRKARGERVFRG